MQRKVKAQQESHVSFKQININHLERTCTTYSAVAQEKDGDNHIYFPLCTG